MKQLSFLLLLLSITIYSRAQSVGIGTSAPNASAQLDVTSTSKGLLIPRMTSAQRLSIVIPAAGLMVYETTTNSFWFYNGMVWSQIGTGGASPWTVSGSDIYNSNAGNVGIGTSAGLLGKLSLKGKLFVTHVNPNDLANGGNRAEVNLHGSGSGVGVVNFLEPDTTVGASVLYSPILNQLYLRSGTNLNQVVLRSNGDVGIGTASPTQRLHVLGNIRSRDTITADDDIVAGDDVRAGGRIDAAGTVRGGALESGGTLTVASNSLFGGTAFVSGELTTNTGVTINNEAGILNFRTAGTDKGFVQLSGNHLRVGTYSGNTSGKFIVRTGGGDHFIIDSDGNAAVGIDPINLGAKFAVFGKSRFIVSSGDAFSTNGNAAIGGDAVVGGKFTVNNNSEAIRINGNDPAINFFESNVQRAYLWVINNDVNLGTSNATGKMYLNSSQINMQTNQVTIGTSITTPSTYKLGVGGRILCEELKVKLQSSGWPDYVFSKDYHLQPLEEVEHFIRTNNHLPNIPSAQVIEKEGIEVGDMQRRMMEKIEELTLYVIELKKEIETLKKK